MSSLNRRFSFNGLEEAQVTRDVEIYKDDALTHLKGDQLSPKAKIVRKTPQELDLEDVTRMRQII